MLKVDKFTVEYQTYILGSDEKKPRFGWVLSSDKQNVVQKAYRIVVYDEKGVCVWDSGKVSSCRSAHIEYDGNELLPRTRYDVSVTVWDNKAQSAQSALTFETGLMRKPSGDFITHTFGESNVPEFVRMFDCKKKIQRARLYATALGVYEVRINGKRVGDIYDAPGWTSYKKRLQYQTYDITELLQDRNEIAAYAGEGWYKGALAWDKRTCVYGDTVAFCAELHVTYSDGTQDVITTDREWRCRLSHILSSSLYDGDTVDTTFASTERYAVKSVSYDGDILSQINEPVRITEILPAKKCFVTPKGETVIDFGQNLTGIVRFRVCGKRGRQVRIAHAETLDSDGNFYTANLRMAKCEDTYILSGSEQILQPIFTFHGFRFIRLHGFESVDIADFEALALHSDMRRTGEFTCSDSRIARLQSNIVWSQRDNFFDIPSDCPQRDERLGWTGDAQVFCRTASFNYNVAPFFEKWLGDLAADQTADGGVAHVVPNVLGDYLSPSSCWGDAATVIPWTLYRVYGDERILARQYGSMKAWVEYVRSQSPHDLWQSGFQYGDWLALDKEEFSDRTGATDKYLIATAFYALSADILAKAAAVLEKKADAVMYAQLHSRIVKAFVKEYVTSTGRLVSETQTACVLALHFDLLPRKFRERVVQTLTENIREHGCHLTTGFVGTPYLCHTLSECGCSDLAARLLKSDGYPSWLYAVDKGATTIWERWNGIFPDGTFFEPSMSSFNHYAYGSIGDWMYQKWAGIDCLQPGYKKISIKPYLVEGVDSISCAFDCMYGKIFVSYRIEKDCVHYVVEIPVNTTAVIRLPGCDKITVGSGVYEFDAKRGDSN